jgi:hypothetical protein
MAFALAVNNLVEAMGKKGCPVCRIFRQASERALESFLWENVNEPDVRQGILAANGFCPIHTRVMVARELYTSSLPLGTNIIYEHLGRVIAGELRSLRPGSAANTIGGLRRGMQQFFARFGLASKNGGPLHPRGECPACTAGNNGGFNSLHVLCEEIPKQGEVQKVYLESDGLCLRHLRDAIVLHSNSFPQAVQLLIDDSVQRLERQSKDMKEYIRKSNWAYRDEKLSEEEDTAWRKTLSFFTGYSGDSFIFRVDDW